MPWIGVGTRMNLLLQWSAISRPFPTGWPAVGHEEAQIPTSDHPEFCLVAALPYRVRTFYR
jgi:hypothetical protein